MQPIDLTVLELRKAIAERKLSAEEAARASIARIEATEPKLHAFLEVFRDRAVADAKAIDAKLASRRSDSADAVLKDLPLAGVPVAIKDNMCLSWGRTTCGSKMLEKYESPYTGTAVQRLVDAGAVIVGKTNLDEFAMGSSTENSAFGPTLNPWDVSRAPGGSSGGSAAAVAARVAPASLGSDTGGSIRQPAGLCGIVGCKPTYGRVSRWGLVAFASSLDQIGPFTRTVGDCALMLDVISGADPLDSTCAPSAPTKCLATLEQPAPTGLRIGVPREARSDRNHPAVARALEKAIETFRVAGAQIVDIELPHLEYGIAAYYIVAPAEASSNLARYDGVRYGHRAKLAPGDDLVALYSKSRAEGFGPEVQRRIMLGTFALSSGYYDAYYNTALKVRRLIKKDFDVAFSAQGGGPGVHAVLMPSSPGPAFRIGEKAGDPLAMYLEDVYTVMANLAGIGGVSVPGGFAEPGEVPGSSGPLPVGVQLFCPAFEEERMLRIARILERGADWNSRRPGL